MIHNGKQVFHHLRGTVLFDPVLHKALQKLCPYVFRRVVKETTFNDIPYAILLLEIPKLATEHLVVGKDVIAFSDRKPVAGSYQQGIGPGDGLGSLLYFVHDLYAKGFQ